MSIWEKLGFKSETKEQQERKQLEAEISSKQEELIQFIKTLENFKKNLSEGGRMVPGDPGRQELMEENIDNIKKELADLRNKLSGK